MLPLRQRKKNRTSYLNFFIGNGFWTYRLPLNKAFNKKHKTVFEDGKMPVKTIVGTLLCMVVAVALAFALGGGTLQTLSSFVLATLSFLLLPLSLLQYAGLWTGIVAWAVGGFVGGLACSNYKRAIAMSIISVVSTAMIAILMISPHIPMLTSDIDVIITNIGLAFGMTLAGALIGATVANRWLPYILAICANTVLPILKALQEC